LCPDGAAPGATRKVDAFFFRENCVGIAFLYSLFNAEECSNNFYGVDLASFCECPGSVVSEDNDCTLCESGQKIDNMDFVFMEEGKNGASDTRTCGQASGYAQFIDNSESCDFLLADAREACCVGGSKSGGSGAASLGIVASLTFAGVMATKSLFL
jgi:hypothetical protein